MKQKQHTILFAGDSGDGIQLTGTLFSDETARFGNDISTFPDFPAEIRAPQGSLGGVSGFQVRFGSKKVYTPGDKADTLVVMNAAALKVNLPRLAEGGTILANADGFDSRNLKSAGYETNPLEDGSLGQYKVYAVDVTARTRDALSDMEMSVKDKDRCKNMFVLGLVCSLFDRPVEGIAENLRKRFSKKPAALESNLKVLEKGFNYWADNGIAIEKILVEKADMPSGTYRNITGNHATALGLMAAADKASLKLFYGGYPITPATDVMHHLAKYKQYGVETFQCEDEIAGVCSAIGASFGGALATTATSGPGMALKTEAIGLAVMTELPLVIVNVQRGGPSTGLPTKTEQADLFQAVFGRNGEAPVAVVAAKSPSDCFHMAFEASRIALEHMTPVILLTDGFIGNGSEPWKLPSAAELPAIKTKKATEKQLSDGKYLPYLRDENGVRAWAVPGMAGFEHRLGGLEKLDGAGTMSTDPENHEKMVKLRQAKIDRIADFIPEQKICRGKDKGKVLVVGWGSTYGVVSTAVEDLIEQGYEVSQTHLDYIVPFPNGLGEMLKNFDKVVVVEMNNGQLIHLIRDRFLVDAIGYNKIKGQPFAEKEIFDKVKEIHG